MPQTPSGTATPYCSVSQLFDFHDVEMVGDLLREGADPRPSRARIADSATPSAEYTRLNRLLLSASGKVETACLVSNRYLPEDLAALTNSGAARLQKLVADLTFWELMQRKQPTAARLENVPGALQAEEELERLRKGERVFGLVESGNAGLPSISDPDPSQMYSAPTQEASRFFGTHGQRRRG
jgi:hypothetical protein